MGFPQPWVCRTSCDKGAGHSQTLKMALSTGGNPRGPGGWVGSALGGSELSLGTWRVRLSWSLPAFAAAASVSRPAASEAQVRLGPACCPEYDGHRPCAASGGVSLGWSGLKTLNCGWTIWWGLLGSSPCELCPTAKPTGGGWLLGCRQRRERFAWRSL